MFLFTPEKIMTCIMSCIKNLSFRGVTGYHNDLFCMDANCIISKVSIVSQTVFSESFGIYPLPKCVTNKKIIINN